MNYVLGFMFSVDLQRVALIRKAKPEWQKGRLNGIGGKIEEGEMPIDAQVREFREETSYLFTTWFPFCVVHVPRREVDTVYCFCARGNLKCLATTTEEPIVICSSDCLPEDTIENLPWLVALAIDHLEDGKPQKVEVFY
jgi:8-oxo-dGTP diphosphatase